MYLNHFKLKRDPFHITPDPSFLYLSPSHKEALASLIYGLKQRKGIVAVTGEVGLGKTTILRFLLQRYRQRAHLKTVFVFNSNISFKVLLKVMFQELGYPLPGKSKSSPNTDQTNQDVNGPSGQSSDETSELVIHLHSLLIQEFQQKNRVILLIDEAQNMPVTTLENLRLLSNLETNTDKLLQIFLIGQPELEETLNTKELRQLKQRVAIRAKLEPLTPKETIAYIQHRLHKAGAKDKRIFTPQALDTIAKLSQGIPRKINILCDNALITGFGYGQTTIGDNIIKEVSNDLEGRSPFWSGRSWAWVIGILLIASLAAATVMTLFSG